MRPLRCLTLALVVTASTLSGPAAQAAAPAGAKAQEGLFTPEADVAALTALASRFPGLVRVERIGTSALGRPLMVVRLGKAARAPRPVVFALFGQHPDEHDMVTLGLTLTRRLAEGYGHEARVTALLDQAEVVTMPMANPDGTAYELLEAPTPFEWRRNRRPQGPVVGANLNRNWDGHWRPGAPSDWPGDAAFSEPETRAVRDWLRAQTRVAGFFDFHSGSSGFSQGMVLTPEADEVPAGLRDRHRQLAEAMAARMTLPGDRREGYWALPSSGVRARLIDAMSRHVPEAHRAQAIASVPADTRVFGTAIAWAACSLGTVSLGLEISRAFAAATPAAYASALASDDAARAPRITSAFVATATDMLATP
jgi:hypothetical protein